MRPEEALSHAVDLIGGQSAMGRLIGVSQASVWRWVDLKKHLPAEHVLKVEATTGVSRHDLRPDLYPLEDTTCPEEARSAVSKGPREDASSEAGSKDSTEGLAA